MFIHSLYKLKFWSDTNCFGLARGSCPTVTVKHYHWCLRFRFQLWERFLFIQPPKSLWNSIANSAVGLGDGFWPWCVLSEPHQSKESLSDSSSVLLARLSSDATVNSHSWIVGQWIHSPPQQMLHPGSDVAYSTSSSVFSMPEALLIQVAHLQFLSRLCGLLPLSACFSSANIGSYKQSSYKWSFPSIYLMYDPVIHQFIKTFILCYCISWVCVLWMVKYRK